MPSLEQLHKLLAADPADAFVLYAIAQEHGNRGEHDKALQFYDRAIGANPGDAYAYFHKAKVLGTVGRTVEQVAALEAGLAAAKRSGDAKAFGELRAALDDLE